MTIAWDAVFHSLLWIVGGAGILAVLSFSAATTGSGMLRRVVSANPWTRASAVLFCGGWALSQTSWLVGGIWVLLGAALIGEWWQRQAPHKQRPAASIAIPPSLLVPPQARGWPAVAAWFTRSQLLWLAILAPLFLFPTPGRSIVLLSLPLFWIARRRTRKHFVPRTPLDGALLLLLIMVLISLFATFDIGFSLPKLSGLLYGIAIYYALIDWATTARRLRGAVVAYGLAGGLLAVAGLLGTAWSMKTTPGGLAAVLGPLSRVVRGLPGAVEGFNPNELAGALCWVVPLQVALATWAWNAEQRPARWSGARRLGWSTLAAFCGGTLLLTQSRSALAGVAAGLALLLLLALPTARQRWRAGAAAALALGLLLAAGRGGIVELLGGGPADVLPANLVSAGQRLQIWAYALQAVRAFPLTGLGMNAFRRVMPLFFPAISRIITGDVPHAHNQLLQAALDLGLPGLIAYLAVWLLAGTLVVQTWRRGTDGWNRAVAAGFGAGLVSSFLYGLTDAVTLGAKPGVFFWALLALLVAMWRQVQTESVPRTGTPEMAAGSSGVAGEAVPPPVRQSPCRSDPAAGRAHGPEAVNLREMCADRKHCMSASTGA